ncbi:MAG: alpha/beta fold hydrolase [Pseudomonadota bacterium]|nr:alpha/beta fold hydrolase [Pseudomonadota bacterium]
MDLPSNTPLRDPPADYCPADGWRWFQPTEGYDAGKQMFYADLRTPAAVQAEPDVTVLLVHGNPECSYTYRHVRDALLASPRPLRIVAPDHIGMGLSDQADYEMLDLHHAANLRQLVRHLDLRRVVLVVHDWGGPIGIGALIDEPERVAGLVVLNTTVFPMPADGYTYRNYPFPWLPWASTASLVPDALWGGVAAAVVSHARPQGFAAFSRLAATWIWRHARGRIAPGTPEHVWSQSFRTTANARSSKRNVRQTPYWGHGYRYRDARHGVQDNHAYYAHIQQQLPHVWGPQGQGIPACGWFGQWDPCGKDSVIAQWHAALPQMRERTHTFADVGHFIEEYKGAEIAASILALPLAGVSPSGG